MKAILTKRPHKRSMLTRLVPIITNVGRTDKTDAYITPGDPFLVSDICEWAVSTLVPEIGLTLEPLDPREVDVQVLSPEFPEESAKRLLETLHPDIRNALVKLMKS